MDLVLKGPVGDLPDGVGPAVLVEHQSSVGGCTSINWIQFFTFLSTKCIKLLRND